MRFVSAACLGAAAVVALAACADSAVEPAAAPVRLQPASSVLGAQPGRYIVWLAADGSVPGNVSSVLASRGARVAQDLRQIRIFAVENLSAAGAAELAARSDIRAIVPDYEIQWILPNERAFAATLELPAAARGRLQGTDQTGAFFYAAYQWNIRRIQADDAYGATPTGPGALVCVLDSGVDFGQLDLVAKVDLSKSASFIGSEPFIEDLNDGANLDEDGDMIVLPAEVPGVISVAATGPIDQMDFDRLALYSNFGSRQGGVEIAGPGGADASEFVVPADLILSACSRFVCGEDGAYVLANGTSFAAPHVAGVGAIAESYLAGNQKANALDACVLLNADAILRSNGSPDLRYGVGRVNALAAGQCIRR